MAVSKARGEIVERGALGSRRAKLVTSQMVKEGYRVELERMARFPIDVRAIQDDNVLNELRDRASDMATALVDRHANLLLGAPGHEPNVEAKHREGMTAMRDELHQIADLVIDDARYGIVGHSQHKPASGVRPLADGKP